jgi:hypothetical protein
MAAVLEIARGYVSRALSVIRVRADGSKAPADRDWRAYSDRLPTDAELAAWFNDDTCYGIGIPGGVASGNLAVLDFETWAAWEEWFAGLDPAAREETRRCPLARPPGGGAHLYVRLPEPVPGVVLARRLVDGRPKTLIEVRGEGHQVLAPGCPAECHPSGRLYEWLRPAWADGSAPTHTVGWAAWFDWIDRAAALNTVTRPAAPPPADTRPRAFRPAGSVSPGDDFNRRGTWEETGLFAAGWQWHRGLGDDRGFVRRPGKAAAAGLSGTLGMVSAKDGGHALFFPFTTDCHPFETAKGYSRFRTYAILNHKSDWSAAAKALAAIGYGDQRTKGTTLSLAAAPGPAVPAAEGGAEPPPAPVDPNPPLRVVYYDEAVPLLDTADFVEGLLIDGTMSVVYGESNCGKTFFALDLALHVAGGTPWRGRDVTKRGVLYLALEGAYGITNRVAAFKKDRANVADLAFGFVPVPLSLRGESGDTMRVIEAAKLAAARLTVPVGLVVVDTLSRALAGGNENASEDMTAFIGQVDLIRAALPAHLAVVHHCGKDAARGARGHSSLRAATDTEIEVSREPGGTTSVARVTKQRDLEGGAEFAFRLEPIELGVNARGKPVFSCVVRDAAAPQRPTADIKAVQKDQEKKRLELERNRLDEAAVLLVIDAEAAKGLPGASLSWIGDYATCSQTRADRAVERLLERGDLVEVAPFEKGAGKGARRVVTNGYGRPKIDLSEG